MRRLSGKYASEDVGGRTWPTRMLGVWAVYAVVAIAVAVTYARLPAANLYNTSGGGPTAGLSRMLVFLNFPVALAAIAIVVLATGRLLAAGARSRPVWATAFVAIVLCAMIAAPGVVDENDLDARPVNVFPAIGVALALLLTIAVARRDDSGPAELQTWERRVRAALILALAVWSIPWIAAELGFYASGLPAVGDHILASEVLPDSDGRMLAAVHLGHHHGFDGVLLALTALVLWPELGRMRPGIARGIAAFLLAMMFSYGVANALEDGWLEQVVKRGATDWEMPSVLRPDLTLAWLGIVVGAALLSLLITRRASAVPFPDRRLP